MAVCYAIETNGGKKERASARETLRKLNYSTSNVSEWLHWNNSKIMHD